MSLDMPKSTPSSGISRPSGALSFSSTSASFSSRVFRWDSSLSIASAFSFSAFPNKEIVSAMYFMSFFAFMSWFATSVCSSIFTNSSVSTCVFGFVSTGFAGSMWLFACVWIGAFTGVGIICSSWVFSGVIGCGSGVDPRPTIPFRRFMSLSVSFSVGILSYWLLTFIYVIEWV